jgi:large subunit ribosomal protein L18
VYRSNKRLQVQLIDDEKGETLFSLLGVGKSKIQAETLGKQFASKMNSLKLTKAVFDRGGFLYHGSIQVFADTLRANGVTF